MTKKQMAEYNKLTSVSDRAKFCLQIGVSAKLNIVDLTPVMQAYVGTILLPVTADTENEAIEKGIAWLKSKIPDEELSI